MLKHMGAFTARGNDGRPYTVNVFFDFIKVGLMGDSEEVEWVKQLRLLDGRPVIRIREGEYRVADGDLVLRSDSPDAS
jgi:hypothetical protein